MGNYIPLGKKINRSVEDTLNEAEEDHFLDCPNAELRLRVAAALLDFLMTVLVTSGIQHLCNALNAHLIHLPVEFANGSNSFWAQTFVFLVGNAEQLSNYIFIVLKVAFFYFYFIWALTFSGGSPGKLLLGLRVLNITSGQLLSFSSALLRTILLPGSILFFFLALLRPDRRGLHEIGSQSVVKRIHGGV